MGFFISKSAASGEKLWMLLKECLSLVNDIGSSVKYVVFDQGTNNQKLKKLLNVTFNKPDFVHVNKKVFAF